MSKGDIHIKIDEVTAEMFDKVVQANCHNRSKLIRMWIDDYIASSAFSCTDETSKSSPKQLRNKHAKYPLK